MVRLITYLAMPWVTVGLGISAVAVFIYQATTESLWGVKLTHPLLATVLLGLLLLALIIAFSVIGVRRMRDEMAHQAEAFEE